MKWFQVFNIKGEFTQLVAIEIGANFDLNQAHDQKELLGSKEEAHTLVSIPSSNFPAGLKFASVEHSRVKLRKWTHCAELTTWLKSSAP